MPDIICFDKNILHIVLHNYQSIEMQINISEVIFSL